MTNHTKVIPFKRASTWTFCDYVEGGVNRIEEWRSQLSEEAQDRFDALLKNTSKIPNNLHWGGFKFLRGEAKSEHVWQLDFIADKRQYRVMGVFGVGIKRAALLLGCYHKGPTYTPPNAITTACKRARALREGRAETHERPIREDI